MPAALGRVVDTHPGEDEVVQTIIIKTNAGLLKRSMSMSASN